MTIRVLVVDDQPLIRAGFTVLIGSADDMTVIGEAATGREAVALVSTARPDVVLMDIRMPDLDGIGATREITRDRAHPDVRILILTTFEIDVYVFQALRAGASGFLGKGAEPDELLDAIRTVHRGDSLLSPAATRTLIAQFLTQPELPPHGSLGLLTEREREILGLVAAGLSNDDIAGRLIVSPHTVKTHVNRAMTKLGVHDRAQLVIAAYEGGLRPPSGHSLRGDPSGVQR